MTKKKKRKDTTNKKKNYYIEILGLLYIVISLIGIGGFGIVGRLITSFAMFLVGTWHYVLLFVLLLIGIYMMVKREKPNYFTSNLLGLYILSIGILLFSHLKYLQGTDLQKLAIITDTVQNFMTATYNVSNIQGGGFLGAIFATIGVCLFAFEGTMIVVWLLLISGFIILTGISIADVFKKVISVSQKVIKKFKKTKMEEEIKREIDKYDKDKKIIITSVDDLIKVSDNEEIIETKEELETPKGYIKPSYNLLLMPKKSTNNLEHEDIKNNIKLLEQVLVDFDIIGKVVAVNIGPAVTQYEIDLKSGTKVSKILSINREIALALAAKDVRIQAPIPGKSTIGIELPNKYVSIVTVREILEQIPNKLKEEKLIVTLGKDIMGKPIFFDINKTPHLLIAGSTGSGKSICINSILISILMRTRPDEVKLLLVDPKKVELNIYNGVPHLITPVVTDPKLANNALKKIVREMEKRYDLFSKSETKNIAGYNKYIQKRNEKLKEEDKIKELPFIVVVIDELADLMLVAAKEVEDSILRLTQMARAAGIHLIVATQRPSTDVITGLIKSNIPSRIAFAVTSGIDSRTILDMSGAEKLLGKGDMLFLPMGDNIPTRVQGTYLTEEEIKAVVEHTIFQQKVKYDETILMTEEEMRAISNVEEQDATEEPLYNAIVEFVIKEGKASASLLQRRFRIGYNRAARVIDLMEERGIIGSANGSKPREVLVKFEEDK